MTRTPGPPGLPGLGSAPAAGPANPFPAFNPESVLAQAIQAHEAGRLEDAERHYRTVLKMAPKDPRIPAHLGSLLLEQGRNEEGAAMMDLTLALDPRQPGMLMNRGAALIALGRFEEALASYTLAIACQPEDVRHEAFNNLGVYLHGLGRPDEAADAYAKAVALKPDFPEAWGNRGISLLTGGQPEAAVKAFDRAVALKPDYADAWTNRGTALQALSRLDEALESFDRALALDPAAGEIWNNRSMALQGLRRFDESIAASAKAVELGGEAVQDSWNNHGIALQTLNRFDEAIEAFDRSIAADPAAASALNNRGLALQGLGRHDEALASFDAAIALKPDYPDAHWNKAIGLILLGRYAEGWPLFEWRWKRSEPGADKPRDLGVPPWLGETSLDGKTLLVHAEQGFGDSLQMLRYIPLLAAQGAKVRLMIPAQLTELASTVEGLAWPPHEIAGRPFDAHIPMMSLPLAMGTTFETVPADVPYIAVPESAAAKWARRLGPGARTRVGLTWSGNANHRNDHNRSLTLQALLPLLDADAEFHSLQKDYRPADAELMRADGRIIDHSAELESYSDTAALIDRMDWVVSVDTSTAHLAGALGKPLLLLLPFAPDYRWGLERSDTPWYPSARLLRQRTPGDWAPVIADALSALKTLKT
jgi:tetratricopeptide (TPR) repeat protein